MSNLKTIFKLGFLEIIDEKKPRKQAVKRANGQNARKIPVNINGKLDSYIYR